MVLGKLVSMVFVVGLGCSFLCGLFSLVYVLFEAICFTSD